jgi:hypothetical protein
VPPSVVKTRVTPNRFPSSDDSIASAETGTLIGTEPIGAVHRHCRSLADFVAGWPWFAAVNAYRTRKTQLSPRAYLENPEETALRLGRTRSGQQKDYLACRFRPALFDYRAAATAPGTLAG